VFALASSLPLTEMRISSSKGRDDHEQANDDCPRFAT
jgi:hypothetical protein